MPEFDLPVMLTFEGYQSATQLVASLEAAKEQVIWEQRATEDGTVIVTILNIVNLEEKADEDDTN